MKNRKIIGLGVCALALAAVAGAVSAQRAVEAKAATPESVYIAFGEGSAWKSWGAKAANTKVHMWGGTSETTWPGTAVTEVTIGGAAYFKVDVPSGTTGMIVTINGGGTNQNKTEDLAVPTDGKNLFTVTSANDKAKQTGEWSVLDTSGEVVPEPVETTYYVVGSFNGWGDAVGDADYAMTKNGDKYELTGLMLEKDTELKVSDGTVWYPGNNVVIGEDGEYTITLDGESVTATKTGDYEGEVTQAEYFLIGSVTDWAQADAYKFTKMDEQKDEKDQYVLNDVELKAKDELKVVSSKNTWYPGGEGNNYVVTADGTYDVYFVPDGGITDEGWYEGYFYLAKEGEDPIDPPTPTPTVEDGVYLIGLEGKWDLTDLVASGETGEDNIFALKGLELEAGDSFKIVSITDGVIDWYNAYGYQELQGGTGAANFESDDSGNLVVSEGKGSTYDIYVNIADEVYINDENATPTPTPTVEDGLYLIGLEGKWDLTDLVASGETGEENLFALVGLKLEAGDSFKIVRVTDNAIDWNEVYGYAELQGGTGAANFDVDNDYNLVVTEGKGSTYDIYVNAAGDLYIDDENATPELPDVPEEDGYYLLGNESFAGEGKAWKYAGGVKMEAVESEEEGHDLAKLENVEIKAGDAIKARSYISEEDHWYTVGKTEGYDFATVDEYGNYFFTKSGTYNFYLNAEGLLYVTGKPAGPIAEEGYLWLSTGDYGMGYDFYVYSWTDADLEKGIQFTENAEWPGVKAADIVGAEVSDKLSFNNAGGLWKIPAAGLYENFIVVVTNGEEEHQTGDLKTEADIYVNVQDGEEATANKDIAKQALVAFEIAALVNGAEDKSVCKADATQAALVVEHYDALGSETGLVDNATLTTYESTEIDPEKVANITLDLVMGQLRKINAGATAWNVGQITKDNAPMIITVSVLAAGAVIAGAMFAIAKKRKAEK